jgi:hypothetical protein
MSAFVGSASTQLVNASGKHSQQVAVMRALDTMG